MVAVRSDDDDLQMRERILVALGLIDGERFNPNQLRRPHGLGGGEWTKGGITGNVDDAFESVFNGLLAGRDVDVAPSAIPALMKEFKAKGAMNMSHLNVTGKGNENLFTRHARDIHRSNMPQLPTTVEGLHPFTDKLAAMGVKARVSQMNPRDLFATQSELDTKLASGLYGQLAKNGWKDSGVLIASSDGSILDGHHRWAGAALVAASGVLVPPPPPHPIQVTVLQVDMPIDDLLALAQDFSGPRQGIGTEDYVALDLAGKQRSRELNVSYDLEFGGKPTTPPPDKNKPYIWINGKWYLVITDTEDGVPKSLDDLSQGK